MDAEALQPLSSEYAMLLACARSRMDERHARTIHELARGPLDWKALLAIGRRHSLFPLLYKQLAAVVPDAVPPESLHRLKELYQGNAARNLLLLGELRSVLRSLAEDGITAIPYKGPILAITGYGDLSLRRFVDLDIIVRKDDVECALRTLSRLGYQSHPIVSPSQQTFLIESQHDLAFKRDEGRLIVELHWKVAPRLFAAGLAAENLWPQATRRPVSGSDMLALSPEDMLLALCVHGAKHLWGRLAWVCDIAEWLGAHPGLRWPELLDQARRTGQERMLFAGLRLAAELLDSPLPEPVLASIDADPAVARLAAQAKQVIFREPPRPPGMVTTMRFNLLARRAWAAKGNYLLHMLSPTEADVRAIRVPRAMRFVYFLARPFRLLAKREHLH